MNDLTRPRRLAPGARVAVVAPSGPVPEERLQAGLDVLRGWDLDPVVAAHALDRHGTFGYLAGTDADRAADLQAAWCDPAVDAVLCARGGYGAQRVVDLLDWDALRAAGPKVLVGFSDITALHEAFAVRLGLVTLHGPMAAGVDFLKNARAQEHLKATLFAPETVRTLTSGGAALVPGRARGVTLGGCLSLLAADLGTPHARPGARGGLLCLEDVGEETYRLDRCLTQLLRAGWLDGVRGVLLGSWEDCGTPDRVRALLADRLGGLGVPVAEEFGFGHCAGALTVPFGVSAELDADAGTLTLDEPALR
ncbi:LD-carboxypeptidase [Streptomyces griseoviridis]|uniref:Muramoyltetrapeptide carboxypeptidase n=3 Tax=Streptomyces TaxID=1883 RepID=A0ABT9LNR8_STRGD|nr:MULTISPECIES: LD-carboxypeptidase [Streptomyces]MDP9685157.1 muramoyltetrapeptide carboxypeptidase [Streptomyces griseoviridis]GGS42200.1 putative carboxypeptidase [Streptomyces niveoruber]GGS95110.1 putative carboxypeptidase [Streptomyces griseoviridis]GGU32431.1 putative carboxypeptidase [Streptomyces daghestanicus]GHI32057.1 putative carboxypeptidase [Streptomyces daghestanicus]